MLFWQVFLVSGGYEDEDTTELMIEGSSWLEVSSAKLPTSMYLFKIVSFDNKLFATGDWKKALIIKLTKTLQFQGGLHSFNNNTYIDYSDVLQFDIDNRRWEAIGKLSSRRHSHAVSVVNASDINCENNNNVP